MHRIASSEGSCSVLDGSLTIDRIFRVAESPTILYECSVIVPRYLHHLPVLLTVLLRDCLLRLCLRIDPRLAPHTDLWSCHSAWSLEWTQVATRCAIGCYCLCIGNLWLLLRLLELAIVDNGIAADLVAGSSPSHRVAEDGSRCQISIVSHVAVLQRARVLLLEQAESLVPCLQWPTRLIHGLHAVGCHGVWPAKIAVVGRECNRQRPSEGIILTLTVHVLIAAS